MVLNIYKLALSSSWFVNGVRSQYSLGLNGYSFDYFNSTNKQGVVNASLEAHWYLGEPIWLTNERPQSSRKSETLYWPNGEASFPSPPHRPSSSRPWTTHGNLVYWMADADRVIESFTRADDPVNFLAWYEAEPDHTLHQNGFYNGALKKKLRELDSLIEYLLNKMESSNLLREINVILTADHGHAEIEDEHVMCLPDYIEMTDLRFGDRMIYPRNESHKIEILRNLTTAIDKYGYKVKVYEKKNLPSEFHYSGSVRVGETIIEPEIGSVTSFNCHKADLEKTYGTGNVKFNSSTHDHNPNRPEMRTILLMKGPTFAPSQKISEVPDNLDLFPLICHILNVVMPSNNGTLTTIRMQYNVVTDALSFWVFFIPPLIIVFLYIDYGCRHTILKNDPNWARHPSGCRVLQSDNIQMYSRDIENTPNGGDAVAMSQLLKDMDSEDEFQLFNGFCDLVFVPLLYIHIFMGLLFLFRWQCQ